MKKPDWIVNTAVDLEGGKTRWREIGVAFVGKNDTVTVLLDAVPVSGKLVLMLPRDKDREVGQEG